VCAEEGCERALPETATARRTYCELHVLPAARVRRHRAHRAALSRAHVSGDWPPERQGRA
jgi:hypothetical protein